MRKSRRTQPNPRLLILKLLLGAEGAPLSARDAVAGCKLFGLRESSVRVALMRLTAAGMIEAEGRGTYRVGPAAAELAGEVAAWRRAEHRVKRWSGPWLAVHAGALGRSDRAALRRRDRALDLGGFRELERGLWVRPDNLVGGVAAARERLQAHGLGAEAAVFGLSDLDEAREARARALWDGKALTRSYAQTRKRLEAWLARAARLEPEVAARECFLLGSAAIRQVVFDPLLPAPLVDVAERRAFVDTVVRFDQAGHAIWRALRTPAAATAEEASLQ